MFVEEETFLVDAAQENLPREDMDEPMPTASRLSGFCPPDLMFGTYNRNNPYHSVPSAIECAHPNLSPHAHTDFQLSGHKRWTLGIEGRRLRQMSGFTSDDFRQVKVNCDLFVFPRSTLP